MPKILSADLAETIQAELSQHPLGAGMDALHGALAGLVSRRTLQRRLAALVREKRVFAQGEARGVKYALALPLAPQFAPQFAPRFPSRVATVLTAQEPDTVQVAGEVYVPTSPAGDEIRAYVRQPVQGRKPVGYNRTFLEGYVPNQSAYLAPEIRAHLHNIGRTPNGARPAGTYARDLMARLMIDLSWASSQLEGNTYTRLDTQNLIERGEAASGKDRREAQMILNHKAAIELLVEEVEDTGFNAFTFFNLHALLSDNLLANAAESGRLRQRIVEVSGTVYHPPGIPQQIEAWFHMVLNKAGAIEDAFEQAFFTMVHIPYLQPFVDVNKRVSRLGANIPLIRDNLCPLSFIDVPERTYVEGTLGVYELQRVELLRDVFVWAYERSCQRYMAIRETVAEPDPLRLRYREVLIQVVADMVRSQQPRSEAVVGALLAPLVTANDAPALTQLALDDLRNLHEGNVSRYRLRLSEFRAWQALQRPA